VSEFDKWPFINDGVIDSVKALEWLVAFDTTSSHKAEEAQSNVELTNELVEFFKLCGAQAYLLEQDTEYPPDSGVMNKSAVLKFGPDIDGGLLVSSHTDGIPAKASEWLKKDEYEQEVPQDPYTLTQSQEAGRTKLEGRGAVDMKQSLVNMMVTAYMLKDKPNALKKPLHFALSWGEEIGCKGTPDINELIKRSGAENVDVAIINEPTGGHVVKAHKGATTTAIKLEADIINDTGVQLDQQIDVNIRGVGGHSSTPEEWIDAGQYAVQLQKAVEQMRSQGHNIEITHFTLGNGSANTVPAEAKFNIAFSGDKSVVLAELNKTLDDIAQQLAVRKEQVKDNPNIKPEDINKIAATHAFADAVIDIEPIYPSAQPSKVEGSIKILEQLQIKAQYLRDAPHLQDATFTRSEAVLNVGDIVIDAGIDSDKPEIKVHSRTTTVVEVDNDANERECIEELIEQAIEASGIRATKERFSHSAYLPDTTKGKEGWLDRVVNTTKTALDRAVNVIDVAFATEAGGISSAIKKGITIVLGTGSLSQGAHRTFEHIFRGQLTNGVKLLTALVDDLCCDRQLNAELDGMVMFTSNASKIIQPQIAR